MSDPLGIADATPSATIRSDGRAGGTPVDDVSPQGLKQRTAHGAVVLIGANAATFLLRTGSMFVMARLLVPRDFGLVGMVTAFTGFLSLFRDAGLSLATIQRNSITPAQVSTLFWVNVLVGVVLAAMGTVAAPFLAYLYHEPTLLWVTVALSASFVLNGAAAQHYAMLQRDLRFPTMAAIDIIGLLVGIAVGVLSALAGLGYWSLVWMTVVPAVVNLVGVWLATGWVPGPPQRRSGIRSMLWFGGTVTLNSVVLYVAYNADKVLLGRFCGADALGIYGRAYQLINLSTENLNSTLGTVAFPALSRVQQDPERLRNYFLKGYGFFLALVVPLIMACALFANDIIRVALGPKWAAAADIFQLLAPATFACAILKPLGWLMLARGQAVRSLQMGFLFAPVVIVGYAVGIPKGAHGVAAGFSIAMVLLIVPLFAWAKHGSLITWKDILKTSGTPILAILVSAGIVWLFAAQSSQVQPALVRLCAESALLFGSYFIVLMFVLKQWKHYAEILQASGLFAKMKRPAEAV